MACCVVWHDYHLMWLVLMVIFACLYVSWIGPLACSNSEWTSETMRWDT